MLEVEVDDHCEKVIESIQHSFESQKGTNCVLRCEGKEIKCHKYVLTAFSSFFEPLEENESMLITNVNFKQLQTLVNAIYYGRVNVSIDEFPTLVRKAEKLGFEQLFSKEAKERCRELLEDESQMASDEDEDDDESGHYRNQEEINLEDTLRAIRSLNEFSSSQERVEEIDEESEESYIKPAMYKKQFDASKTASVSPSIPKSDSGALQNPNFDMPSEGNSISVCNHSSKSQSQVIINTSLLDIDDESSNHQLDDDEIPEEITVSIAPNDLVANDLPTDLRHNTAQCLQTRRSSNPASFRYLKSGPSSPSSKPININITSKSALSPTIVPNSSMGPSLTITSLPTNSSPSLTLASSASSSKQKSTPCRIGSGYSVAPRLSTATSITIVSQTEPSSGSLTSKPQLLSQVIKKPNGRKSTDVDEESTSTLDATRSIQMSSSSSTYVQSGIVLISSEPGPSHGKKNPARAVRHLTEGPNAYTVDLTDEQEEEEDEEYSEDDEDNWDDFRIEGDEDDWRNGRTGFSGSRSGLWTDEGPSSQKKRRTRDPKKFKNRYPCPECGKILANFYYKEEHVRVKHQKQNLSCSEIGCSFEVLERDKFNEHLKKAHGKEIKRGRPKSDP